MIDPRLSEIASLRENGLTFKEIGQTFGFSKQRAQLLHKRYIKRRVEEKELSDNDPELDGAVCACGCNQPIPIVPGRKNRIDCENDKGEPESYLMECWDRIVKGGG